LKQMVLKHSGIAESLRAEVLRLRRWRFGRSSEVIDTNIAPELPLAGGESAPPPSRQDVSDPPPSRNVGHFKNCGGRDHHTSVSGESFDFCTSGNRTRDSEGGIAGMLDPSHVSRSFASTLKAIRTYAETSPEVLAEMSTPHRC